MGASPLRDSLLPEQLLVKPCRELCIRFPLRSFHIMGVARVVFKEYPERMVLISVRYDGETR